MNRDLNRNAYKTTGVVRHYAQLNRLQPAEQNVLERFRPQLSSMSMLDIGVGAGRTTQHFAPLAGEYVGIDYSAEMVAACRQRCPDVGRLEVGDARQLRYADNAFDFILFSFNGMDYVSHTDRLKILQEIYRVGRPGCSLFFSSHNLRAIAPSFHVKTHLSVNIFSAYVDLVMFGLLRLMNPDASFEKANTADHLIIRDESHNFRLRTYYICPSAQVQQLKFCFHQIEIYSWRRGLILEASDSAFREDRWLYYLCKVDARAKAA
ncbi:MAG: class I SAM-dependent methyltransferase [Elainellaceae cyanobacterium]